MGTFATVTLIGAATTAVLSAGAGVAAAEDTPVATPVIAPGEPDPNGTGSASVLTYLVDALASGSAQPAAAHQVR
ncbi:hypothetical protein AB0L57_23215 [Nocardia sp. NPDC052254]|uniref:hypothetical protein n=1 Tax=Nocardia sp. NPDC052254 TaxID=3155681 RepID=UPI0034319D70